MNFIGTKKKMGDNRKTQPLAFVKVTHDPRAKAMTMAEIGQKAIFLGIQPGQMNKTELIHSIQRAEGNTSCFGTANGQCLHTDCCFMADCLAVQKST
ncbi:MAG: hypothetical protein ABSE89_12140 [Sedimentisphaerales bacterium]